MFVWLFAGLEALLILGLGEDPLTPNDLVGTFTFLAFLAFILLPMRLRFCIFWVTVLSVVHSIIVGVSSERLDEYSSNQVRCNLYISKLNFRLELVASGLASHGMRNNGENGQLVYMSV
jgi:hypothetical protein